MKTTRQIMEEIEGLAKGNGRGTRRHFRDVAVALGGDEEKARAVADNCNLEACNLYLVCLMAERDAIGKRSLTTRG